MKCHTKLKLKDSVSDFSITFGHFNFQAPINLLTSEECQRILIAALGGEMVKRCLT